MTALPTLEQALEKRSQGVKHFEPETEFALVMHDLGLTQDEAAEAIFDETNHQISQGTISRILKGNARTGTIALALYALNNIKNKQSSLVDPRYQGCNTYTEDNHTEHCTHFIQAATEQDAINRLVELGFSLHETRNTTDTDCTGQWFRSSPVVDFISPRGCYAVTTTLRRDV